MSGDTTYQALERLTHMPDRTGNQGDRIAGQLYNDVLIEGGDISGVTIHDLAAPIPAADLDIYGSPLIRASNAIVLIGDSRIQEEFSSGTGGISFNNAGAFVRANISLGWPFEIVNVSGLSGDTTANMLTRLDAASITPSSSWMIQKKPGWVFTEIGGNDIINGIALATTKANLIEIFNTYLATGINVIYMPPYGFTTPYAAMTQPQVLAFTELAEWAQDYAAKNYGIICIPSQQWLADYSTVATSVSGAPASGMTMDGLHASGVGAGVLGEGPIADTLRPIVAQMNRSLWVNTNLLGTTGNTDNLVHNGWCIQGAGSGTKGLNVTGTVADGLSAAALSGSIAAVASVVTRMTAAGEMLDIFNDFVPGYCQKLAITGAGSTAEIMSTGSTVTTVPGTAPWIAQVDIGAVATTGSITSLSLDAIATDFSYGGVCMSDTNELGTGAPITSTYFQGTLRTPPFTIPAGKTSFYVMIFVSTTVGAVVNLYYSNLKMIQLQA